MNLTDIKNVFAGSLSQNEPILPQQGWQTLFNGQDIQDWAHVGEGRFILANNLLQTEGNMGLFWYTKQKFGNCILRVVYKVNADNANSGVFVRIAEPPADAWYAVHHGYEIQIADTGKDAYDAYHATGSVYSLTPAKQPTPSLPVGEWNTLDIFLEDTAIKVYLNGQLVSSLLPGQPVPEQKKETEPSRAAIRPVYGYIGLQNHDEEAGVHVWFKEVSVLALDKIKGADASSS